MIQVSNAEICQICARICSYIQSNPDEHQPIIKCLYYYKDDIEKYPIYRQCAIDMGCMDKHSNHNILPYIELKSITFKDKNKTVYYENGVRIIFIED